MQKGDPDYHKSRIPGINRGTSKKNQSQKVFMPYAFYKNQVIIKKGGDKE
jgi:hypothetical protein